MSHPLVSDPLDTWNLSGCVDDDDNYDDDNYDEETVMVVGGGSMSSPCPVRR